MRNDSLMFAKFGITDENEFRIKCIETGNRLNKSRDLGGRIVLVRHAVRGETRFGSQSAPDTQQRCLQVRSPRGWNRRRYELQAGKVHQRLLQLRQHPCFPFKQGSLGQEGGRGEARKGGRAWREHRPCDDDHSRHPGSSYELQQRRARHEVKQGVHRRQRSENYCLAPVIAKSGSSNRSGTSDRLINERSILSCFCALKQRGFGESASAFLRFQVYYVDVFRRFSKYVERIPIFVDLR